MAPLLDDPRLPSRFWDKVVPEPNSGCWIWTAAVHGDGYGALHIGSRSDGTRRVVGAHCLAFESLVGPVPAGLELDHKCRVRCCVNPEHLEPVTTAENHRRGNGDALTRARHRAKTHCPAGHEYSGDNVRVDRRNKNAPPTERRCRACARARKLRARQTHIKETSP